MRSNREVYDLNVTTSVMLSIVGERERTHLGSMRMHGLGQVKCFSSPTRFMLRLLPQLTIIIGSTCNFLIARDLQDSKYKWPGVYFFIRAAQGRNNAPYTVNVCV